MPKVTKAAWLTVRPDGRQPISAGPATRDGWLGADLTIRTPDGGVSEPIGITAGGLNSRAFIVIPHTFSIHTETDGLKHIIELRAE